jgi:hypothetical protein
MKKIFISFTLLLTIITLSGCDMFLQNSPISEPNEPNDVIDNKDDYNNNKDLVCNGDPNFVVIDDVCYPINQLITDNIQMFSDMIITNYNESLQLMNDYVADLSNSTGIAVIPEEVYESNINPQSVPNRADGDESTTSSENENVIVKLTEDGFFEKVSFTDSSGEYVNVLPNPLALEVYGPFTIIIFEVNNSYHYNENIDFASKLWESFYSGGVYLLHNETGKMFSTQDIIVREETYTYTDNQSRTVRLTVNLNQPVIETRMEPVYDKFGKQMFNEFGDPILEEVQNELKDQDGNPLVFSEGPIKTEIIQVPLTEMIEVPVLDEDGNEVLDENGNVVLTKEEVPVLDENGEQKYEEQLVAVVDENGNPVYEEEFEVEIYIDDIREITEINYFSEMKDNALTPLAQKFLDSILQDYYNWSYYRVNNHVLQYNSFVYDSNFIFYRTEKQNNDSMEHIITKLSFDFDTNEVIVEELVNLSKAGLDQCELMYDPDTKVFICQTYDQNLKIYSETNGLKTIEDTKNMQVVSMPNGQLFFYRWEEEYVEELGYQTTALYTINPDGTFNKSYIELGETFEIANGFTWNGVNYNLFDGEGNQLNDYNTHIQVVYQNGDYYIDSFDLTISEIEEFSSIRVECEQEYCYYSIETQILDENGEVISSLSRGLDSSQTDSIPPVLIQYQIDDTTTFRYSKEWVNEEKLCKNELGCSNGFSIYDEKINQWGVSLYETFLVNYQDRMIQQMRIPENSAAVYEYSTMVSSPICENDHCYEMIPMKLYDINGNLLFDNDIYREYEKDEQIPFRYEYSITNNTSIVYSTETCTDDICYQSVIIDDTWIDISLENGDHYINSITLHESDKQAITEDLYTSEICTNIDGCYQPYVTYRVVDDSMNVLYEFRGSVHVEYGYKQAYIVTININDVEIDYAYESYEQDDYCTNDSCKRWVEYILIDGDEQIHLGNEEQTFYNGDRVYDRIELLPTSLINESYEEICIHDYGCHMATSNFTIVDENGNTIETYTDNYPQYIEVIFQKGDKLPNTDDFHITLIASNITYQMRRSSIHDFINEMQNAVQLQENMFFIERQSWTPGTYNFILTFNEETNRYKLSYTNLNSMTDFTKLNDSYIAINDSKTAIFKLTALERYSTDDFYYFDEVNLTQGLEINEISDLIVDYDGSIYFTGIDNFIQDITGTIDELGVISIDTVYTEREIIRVRPIN